MNALSILSNKESNEIYIGKIPSTDEESAVLFEAMNTPSNPVNQAINIPLKIVNVFCQYVTIDNTNKKDESEPDTVTLPRTVLITEDGNSYGCTSTGIYNSLEKLFAIYGSPNDWTAPMEMVVKQVAVKNGSMLTLSLISAHGNKPHF